MPFAIVKKGWCFLALFSVLSQTTWLFVHRAFAASQRFAPAHTSRFEFASSNEQPDDPANPVRLQLPREVDLGSDLKAVLMLANGSKSIEEFEVQYNVTATLNGGEHVGIIVPIKSTVVEVYPNGNKSLSIIGKWDVVEPLCSVAEFASLSSVVTRKWDGKKWTFNSDIPLGELPVVISTSAVSPVPVGSELGATVRISNPLSRPLANATVKISAGSQRLLINDDEDEETIEIGSMGAFEIRAFHPVFHAKLDGYSSISAVFSANGLPSGSSVVDMNVFRCDGDLNEDTIVDDGDLVLFLNAYKLGECRNRRMDVRCLADLNRDQRVDDQDFRLFVTAYDACMCEPPSLRH